MTPFFNEEYALLTFKSKCITIVSAYNNSTIYNENIHFF